MTDQLKKIYPSLIQYEERGSGADDGYHWFMTADNDIIGIHESEVDDKNLAVLTAFLKPYHNEFPEMTAEELKWRQAIESGLAAEDAETANPYRFVYFSIKENQISPEIFKEAVHELFPGSVPILWDNGHEGILIEHTEIGSDSIVYEEIIDILMSDLYIKINFLVGPFKEGMEKAASYHAFMKKAAAAIFASSDKAVANLSDAVPYMLIGQADSAGHQHIREMILQDYAEDEETLKMIDVFTRYNLNVSETAKALHLHRNSLQYRLDRFAENTGIDIRKFHHAMAVYLAMLVEPSN
ncbi:Carbohydrate diacid regulator [Planococcus massiliensis]|uniref:Carbohydrate diacid regulator n=1 Tax=Planococcus massiliensis TaxID=1499687 RepID=A0A098ENI1_9BACL|nr:helix-turn-helix domain-containing protein [Planococcus massiliensis]CEG23848.1 Carbohydrate diacid regulator [Planococcus massiliensis]